MTGIIVFAAFAALTQLGIAEELVAPTFLILLGSVAPAAALVFGLGGQNVAGRVVEDGYRKSGEAREQIQQHRQRQDGSSESSFTRVDSKDRPSARPTRGLRRGRGNKSPAPFRGCDSSRVWGEKKGRTRRPALGRVAVGCLPG